MKKRKGIKKRFAALTMAVILAWATIDAPIIAAGSQEVPCEHHMEHNEDCGYTEGVDFSPCTHEHGQECYSEVTSCLHSHDENCGYVEGEEDSCSHECNVENGCIISALNCTHEHDEECGYQTAVEGTPCIYECEECANASNEGLDTVSGNEVSEETTECTCETDDPAFHATNCPAYIASENPQCFCAEKCTDDTLNVWCDVCGVQGVSACQGEDTVTAYEILASGNCGAEGDGSNVTWTLDSEGTLTISGTGAMADYELVLEYPYHYTTPWHDTDNDGEYQNSNIKKVVVNEGITHIGNAAFRDFTELTSISIPNTVKSIGNGSVSYCSKLESLVIPDSVTSIGKEAFDYNRMLTSVTIGNSVESIGAYAFSNVGWDAGTNFTITLPKSVTYIDSRAFSSISRGATIRYSCSYNEGNGYSTENTNATLEQYHLYEYSSSGNKINCSGCTCGEYSSSTATLSLSSDEPIYYTGEEIKPAVTVTYSDDWVGDEIEPNESNCTYSDNINAGTATCTFKYAEGVEASLDFTIEKADSVITAAPTPADLVYDGTAQNLINAGTTTDGEMQYSLDGTNYSSTIPTGTDAGDYTVWYKVDGNENHGDTTPESVKVTIAPKPLVIGTVTASDRVFDGTDKVEILSADIGAYDGDDVSVRATATIDSMNVGEYSTADLSNITLTGSDASNYSIEASAEDVFLMPGVIISKADVPVLPRGSKTYASNKSYEGESISITGLPADCGEVEYVLLSVSGDMLENISLDANGKITYDLKALNSDTEDLQATIDININMDNYNTVFYKLTITRTEKLPQNISAQNLSLTYGDADAKISVTGAKTDLTYEVISDSNNNGDVITVDANGKVSIKNAGTAVIKITAKESDTYAEVGHEITVTVDKRPVNVPAKDSTVYTYTGKEQTYSIASSPYYTIANATHTNAGKYEVFVTLNDNCVWNGDLPIYEFVIKPATVTITAKSYTVEKGDTLPTFYYDVTGLVNNETLPITVSIACTALDTKTVGTYDITVSGVASSENYTYTYKKGVLEIWTSDEAPFIMGDDGKMGWDAISDEIEDANTGDTIVVDMNGATVVPGDIIEEARDSGVTITFVLDNGLTWTIDGSTVTDEGYNISDINFDVTVEDDNNPLNNIPLDVINNVTGERETIEVNLAYSGNFGFEAVLTANLGSDNAGYYANLYYYNPTTGKLEYICADVIASNGEAELAFTHASDYLVVIDDVDLGKAPTGGGQGSSNAENSTVNKVDTGKDEAPDTGDTGTLYLWVIMLCSIFGMAGITCYERIARKKK
ncbi:MAG: hypothetical protein E7284_06930 [Lachnospiraceae bacterium]|nr:hypothetical protein [Lachnospiraceae bacterium]